MKLIVITNIIAPNRIPIFNNLAKTKDIELKVIFFSENDPHRKWKVYKNDIDFNYEILKCLHFFFRAIETPVYLHWGLWRALKKYKPDAICVIGYHHMAAWESLLYGKLNNTKIILWGGSHLLSGFIKNFLTELYKKIIVPKFDSYVTYGTSAREQLAHYGAQYKKIVVGCNTVDIEWFMAKSRQISEVKRKDFKERFSAKNVLYVGDFMSRKGVFNLIKAFEKLNNKNVGLILVGDGPEKSKYLEYINSHKICNIFFEGFIHKENIIKYYKIADIFVLPSFNEVWGLVVNEAMACGLPILSSVFAGATRDIVKDGVNGYSFDPNNIDELTVKLRDLLTDDKKRIEMGQKSIEIIKYKTPAFYAEKIAEAITI
ncbi:glycosyltransferase family 4 protein [bacterium]|nr:glycosyltransferase family 4 protein [bacterium]